MSVSGSCTVVFEYLNRSVRLNKFTLKQNKTSINKVIRNENRRIFVPNRYLYIEFVFRTYNETFRRSTDVLLRLWIFFGLDPQFPTSWPSWLRRETVNLKIVSSTLTEVVYIFTPFFFFKIEKHDRMIIWEFDDSLHKYFITS